MNELVEIVGLTKAYDARSVAVNNITLTLPRGKIIGLLGPNGSGKTTLIKMMNGLLTPTSGSIKINGHFVGAQTKARVAYLPDRTYLAGGQTISEIFSSVGTSSLREYFITEEVTKTTIAIVNKTAISMILFFINL